MTKALQNKLDELTSLLASAKDHKQQIKQLEQSIQRLISRQPDLPHKGTDVWCWHGGYCYYGQRLHHGKIEQVVWRSTIKCFKVGVRVDEGGLIWRTLDRIWATEKEAKRWDIMREIAGILCERSQRQSIIWSLLRKSWTT